MITTMRKEINKLNYKIKNMMNKLGDFENLEREYYNQYYITDCAQDFAPGKDNTFSIAPMTSKGWVEDSTNIGVKLNWKDATKNYFLGFTEKFNLDGLHLGFTNLSINSENKVLGIMLSNKLKDKWLSGENLLITIDFSSGTVSTASGVSLGRSEYLVYGNTGAIPFDLSFAMTEGGDLNMTVLSPLGTDVLTLPASALTGMANFTDPSACYVSLSPWATKSTMSIEVTAIHTEEQVEPSEPTEPTEPDDTENEKPLEEMSLFELIGELFKRLFASIGKFFAELFGG